MHSISLCTHCHSSFQEVKKKKTSIECQQGKKKLWIFFGFFWFFWFFLVFLVFFGFFGFFWFFLFSDSLLVFVFFLFCLRSKFLFFLSSFFALVVFFLSFFFFFFHNFFFSEAELP